VIEFVLPQDKQDKTDYLPKIWFHVAHHAETDVMEEIPVPLGTGIKEPELSQEIFTEITLCVNHTFWPHVTTTQPDNTTHAQLSSQPQLAKIPAIHHTKLITKPIKELPQMPTTSILMLKPSKLKS
jgi:hypothetical protein